MTLPSVIFSKNQNTKPPKMVKKAIFVLPKSDKKLFSRKIGKGSKIARFVITLHSVKKEGFYSHSFIIG